MASSKIPTTYLEGIDATNKIYEGSNVNTLSWTATEDCWVYVYTNSTSTGGSPRGVQVDGKWVFEHIGAIAGTTFPVKKGQVVYASGNPIYNFTAYGILR